MSCYTGQDSEKSERRNEEAPTGGGGPRRVSLISTPQGPLKAQDIGHRLPIAGRGGRFLAP